MKKRVACLTWWLLGMAVFLLNGCWLAGETPPVELTTARSDFKVAILLPGPANDKAWNQSGYEGLKLIEQEFKAETAFVERLEGPELAVRSREAAHRFADVVVQDAERRDEDQDCERGGEQGSDAGHE